MCPFCFPFYPLSQRILLLSRLKHCFWDYPRPALPPARTAVPQPGLPLGYPPCRWCSLRTVLLPMRTPPAVPQSRSFPQAAVHRSNQSPSRLSPGSRRKNQAINKAPAVRRMPCFVSWEFLLTCGFIPGSGGFPECSAQHRTVRRRAAAKSAAEEAAHRRSKWRYPDQAGMPSVRWQWLCGAGH